MLTGIWPCPTPSGKLAQEYFVAFDQARGTKVLMVPPLFDEHNKLRRQIVAVMRRLDEAGIDTVLPDCPGWNESSCRLRDQTCTGWRDALEAAAAFGEATHVLAWRSGALVAPRHLPGWRYAPIGGDQLLRAMMRARTIAAREAGGQETIDEIAQAGRDEGVTLAGWHLGAQLFHELEQAKAPPAEKQQDIAQSALGGTGLWLRAEPGYDAQQAEALAAIVLESAR